MISKYLLPLLAVLGFSFGVLSVVRGNQPASVAAPAAQPAQAPFHSFIAGAGIVEAESRNIDVGTSLPGIVAELNVRVGQQVKAGAPLFRIDERETRAQLAIKRADLAKTRAEVTEAEAGLRDAQSLLNFAEAVTDKRAISSEELERRRNAALIAKAKLESARAGVKQAEAGLAASETELERLTVRAPIDGEILQANVRPGEFAPTGVMSKPLLVMGRLDALHVRVDIDENDAWRFDRNGKAVAFLRGNRDFSTELTLAYVEPYVVPKKSLTGDTTERVDTRVLQALYRFDPNKLNTYVGQQMDVYIEAQAFEPKTAQPAANASGNPS